MAANSNDSGNATKIESQGMAMIVHKQSFNESDNSSSNQFSASSGPSIAMPSLSKIITGSSGSPPASISTKMLVSATNPFQSNTGSKQAKGTIVSMELADENGNTLAINNTEEPFVIRVPAPEPAQAFRTSVDLISFAYYKTVLLTNSSSMHVVTIPDSVGDIYHVYVKYSANPATDDLRYPTESNFDWVFTLPNNNTYDEQLYELKYTAFLGINETKGAGTYYIGIKLASNLFFFVEINKYFERFY